MTKGRQILSHCPFKREALNMLVYHYLNGSLNIVCSFLLKGNDGKVHKGDSPTGIFLVLSLFS